MQTVIIQKVKVSQHTVGEISISWEVNDTSQDIHFFIERSGSNNPADFIQINKIAIIKTYGYIDKTFNTESLNRQIYYRVKAINLKTNDIIYSEIIKLDKEQSNYIGLAIAKNKNILLERFVGTKCYAYIRKTFGEKCNHCYNAVRQKSIDSNCPQCFGTTFSGGYFSPILIYVQTNPLVKANIKSALQNAENMRIDGLWCGNNPILSPGDILIEAEDSDVRYIIESPIQRTEQHGALIIQTFPATIIQSSRIEMTIPIQENVLSINDVNVFRRDHL